MKNERRDSATSPTPMLDSLIARLPLPSLEVTVSVQLIPVTQAHDRLQEKMAAGSLTQKDIEVELNALPAIGGIEEGKMQLLRFIQMNLPEYDIKKLPLE